MDKDARIYVAGHRGMVGQAIVRRLQAEGFAAPITRTHGQLDLTDQAAVRAFFEAERPSHVFLAAAKVGGILANDSYPADFIRDNLAIQTNVIDAAWRSGAEKLLFLGSSCIYPRDAAQPIKEDYLLTGPLEPTNQWYAIAKIAGIKMCQAYRQQYGFNAICTQPTNVFGPGDNYDPETSHVLAALIRKFHEAVRRGDDEVVVWGTGRPQREFIHVDDLADACLFLMQAYDEPDIINIGTGKDISIAELAAMIGDIAGFEGTIVYDSGKPDGTPRKLLDVGRLSALGWQAQIPLKAGIKRTYDEAAPVLGDASAST